VRGARLRRDRERERVRKEEAEVVVRPRSGRRRPPLDRFGGLEGPASGLIAVCGAEKSVEGRVVRREEARWRKKRSETSRRKCGVRIDRIAERRGPGPDLSQRLRGGRREHELYDLGR